MSLSVSPSYMLFGSYRNNARKSVCDAAFLLCDLFAKLRPVMLFAQDLVYFIFILHSSFIYFVMMVVYACVCVCVYVCAVSEDKHVLLCRGKPHPDC